MSKKILFVDHAGVLGGGELSLLTIASALREQSEVVLFEEGPFRERLEAANVRVTLIPLPESVRNISRDGGIKKDLLAIPGLLRQCYKLSRLARSFDVIYTNSQKSMIVGALAGMFSRKPVVWHLRDLLDESHFSGGHVKLAVTVANKFVSLVIANSESTRTAFVAAGGKSSIVETIYNGIEPEPFRNVSPSSREKLRRELRVPDDALLLGCFSRLADWKGQHVLLEAVRNQTDLHVALVGDALFAPDKSYKALLHSLVQRYRMDDRVHFLGFRSDIPELMSACDVVVHSSTAPEPFGRVIVEGMLASKVVVATDAGGAAELIEQDETGMLVPPNDATAMQGALAILESDPALRDRLAQKGHQTALERFSSDRMIDEIKKAVEQLT